MQTDFQYTLSIKPARKLNVYLAWDRLDGQELFRLGVGQDYVGVTREDLLWLKQHANSLLGLPANPDNVITAKHTRTRSTLTSNELGVVVQLVESVVKYTLMRRDFQGSVREVHLDVLELMWLRNRGVDELLRVIERV